MRGIGADLSLDALDLARGHGLRDLMDASVVALPVVSQGVDLVISNDVLQHLPEGDDRRAVAESYRVLKPGGFFCVRSNLGAPVAAGSVPSSALRPAESLCPPRFAGGRILDSQAPCFFTRWPRLWSVLRHHARGGQRRARSPTDCRSLCPRRRSTPRSICTHVSRTRSSDGFRLASRTGTRRSSSRKSLGAPERGSRRELQSLYCGADERRADGRTDRPRRRGAAHSPSRDCRDSRPEARRRRRELRRDGSPRDGAFSGRACLFGRARAALRVPARSRHRRDAAGIFTTSTRKRRSRRGRMSFAKSPSSPPCRRRTT